MKRELLFPVLAALVVCFAFYHFRAGSPQAAEAKALYYVDPMHPAYRSSKPGIAPDCGMRLVPVYASSSVDAATEPRGLQVDPQTMQRYGIRLAKVEASAGDTTVRVFGRVAADDTRVYRVNFGAAGLVKETRGDATGDRVRKNQRLATIYSSELIYAAAGFLSGSARIPSEGMRESAASPTSVSAGAKADYLRNLGMSDVQIEELKASRKIPEDIAVVSPVDGFVLSRSITPGVRIEKDAELYRIVDLSHVWIFAEIFGKDASAFRPGAAARVTLPDIGESYAARVSDALPEVDPATRTLKVRLDVQNAGMRLRPGMFVNVEIPVRMREGLTVPADALVDSGLSRRVYVESANGRLEPRVVETGWRHDDRVEIVSGLRAGEQVVSGATFLIDSESRLQAPDAGAVQPRQTGPGNEGSRRLESAR